MKLEDLLKDDQETLEKVKEAIKKVNDTIGDNNKKIRYADLGEGEYISKGKYTDLETKYNTLKDTPNEFEKKYNDLMAEKDTAINTEKEKLSSVLKNMAVENAINSLGIEDKLTKAGIKSYINVNDIKLDDNYNVVDGLDNQINSIKEQFKDSFTKPEVTVVSTGTTVPKTEQARVYSSIDEIKSMTTEQIMADYDNIVQQLSKLS